MAKGESPGFSMHVMLPFGLPACPCSAKRCIVYVPLIDHSVVSIVSVRMMMLYFIKKLSGSITFAFLSPSMFQRSTLRDCCLSLCRLSALSWV